MRIQSLNVSSALCSVTFSCSTCMYKNSKIAKNENVPVDGYISSIDSVTPTGTDSEDILPSITAPSLISADGSLPTRRTHKSLTCSPSLFNMVCLVPLSNHREPWVGCTLSENSQGYTYMYFLFDVVPLMCLCCTSYVPLLFLLGTLVLPL